MRVEFFHADRQADRHEETVVAFCCFATFLETGGA